MPQVMNSPCARLMMPIMPKMMARPADARTRNAKTSANWKAMEKISANIDWRSWVARAGVAFDVEASFPYFFDGRLDGAYCSFGSDLVRSQPTSPSQYGLISPKSLITFTEWSG